MRLDRLQQQAGSSMVTTNTLASMDEEDDSALKRFNIILKVRGPSREGYTGLSFKVGQLHSWQDGASCTTTPVCRICQALQCI